MQTEGHHHPRRIGNLCGKLETALLVSIPGQTGHGNPTGREKGMAGKMQAAPSFFQKKRIWNPVKLPHSLHDVSKRGNLTHHELFSRPFPQLHPENSFPLRLPFPECNDGYLDKLFSFDQECFAFMKANIPPFQNSAPALSSADILPPLFTVMLSPESGFPPFIPE